MAGRTSLTVIQLNDSHTCFDLHQEMFWQGGQAVFSLAEGYTRIAALVKQEDIKLKHNAVRQH